jgi:hypothetical protein
MAQYLNLSPRGEILSYFEFDDRDPTTLLQFAYKRRILKHGPVDSSEFYVTDKSIVTERPALDPAITAGAGGFCISGLPVPSTVTVDGTEYTVDDGAFEFETPIHATFKLTIDSWPYRTWRGEVTT